VWFDKKRGVYHNIVHVRRENTYGLHYFSLDGVKWTASPGKGQAYTDKIDYADGSSDVFACRERPHVIQNKAGEIIALTNGAARVTCHDSTQAHPQDYSFTLLQPIGQ
jgi:hypothetical protein